MDIGEPLQEILVLPAELPVPGPDRPDSAVQERSDEPAYDAD